MAKKTNNKTLVIILVVLAGLFLLTRYLKDRNRDLSALPSDLVTVDSAAVTGFTIYPKSGGDKIEFTNDGGSWTVACNGVRAEATAGGPERLLEELRAIKPTRLAAKSSEQWEKFQITDSLATRIEIMERGGAESLNLYIGKFSYSAPPGGMSQYGGSRNVQGATYVRLGNEGKVYATEGFLAMSINQSFNSWRKADFLKFNKEDVTNLVFSYPGDSSFQAIKADSIWLVDGAQPDSAKWVTYLNTISNRQDRTFADQFTPTGQPDFSLTISGNNMNSVQLDAFADSAGGQFFLTSSLNPGVYFQSAKKGLFSSVFVGKGHFSR